MEPRCALLHRGGGVNVNDGTHGIRTRDLPADNRLRYQLRQRPVGIGDAVRIAVAIGLHGLVVLWVLREPVAGVEPATH